jgi:hypothetical protein
MKRIFFAVFSALALASVGCSSSSHDGNASTDPSEEALSADSTSGYPECPGLGWTQSIKDWNGVHGSYIRLGLAAPGEFSQLTILEDQSEANRGLPPYVRTLSSFTADSGRVALGTDNPAIGAGMAFYDDALSQDGEKDIYFVLAQKRSAFGGIRGICLGKAWDKNTGEVTNSLPFMLTKLGL